MDQNLQNILNQYWGHTTFRPKQLEIIQAVLKKQDTLALLPTGGGKSICFQLPALVQDGICIVISPLIALMYDQVKNLKKRGIKALMLHSGMSTREIDITLDNAVYGDFKFLYVAPERLKTTLFIERFKKMNVSFVAVDEAHCISQWGYDFRPAYLEIATLRTWKPKLHFLALTATATTKVVEDIQTQLQFKQPHLIKNSFKRANLTYIRYETENKLDFIIRFCKNNTATGIIYCNTRRDTKTLYQHLNNQGINAGYYHAGLSKEEREQKQNDWMSGKLKIIISTNAFGMGIDKADVRYVLHYGVPFTIESYFQEVGRAGRDLKPAQGILLFNQKDILELKSNLALKYPEISFIREVYFSLGNHLQIAIGAGEKETYPLNLADFSNKYNLNLYSTYAALKILESVELIQLNEFSFLPSRLKILVQKIDLYQYQVKDKVLNLIIQFLLRSHIGLFDDYLTINETVIAKKISISTKTLIEKLHFLMQQQVIDYIHSSKGQQVFYIKERLADQNFSIPSKFYHQKKEEAQDKLDAILGFLKTKQCTQVYLLEYFGEEITENCNQCNSCTKNPFLVSSTVKEEILAFCLEELKDKQAVEIDSILQKYKDINTASVLNTLRWLSEFKHFEIDLEGRVLSK
ncbi:RecQ family ATP-dependent DNA helicase [Putridiphycobacter roseus]|uniref:ATP-dependent DNA helicase RecQ n=1 Tax=Putridiphycobacter roseus TaxID=2219161 RepID=A0A2W1MZ37_9FLAO|nr:ATP-dependent DNA helicase RecQ [Putridiphycobacter roseus]PZE17469.1 RecQ family ATP-dependent DNA helicase [Putridiphycobacter roseus]